MGKKKRKETKNKTLVRAVTIVIGLAFAVPMMAGALASVFGQDDSNYQNAETASSADVAQQIQLQTDGYLQVLEREPKNPTAIQGLMEIAGMHAQMGDAPKAISVLEEVVERAPERQEVAAILAQLKQQEAAAKKTEAEAAKTKATEKE